MFESQIIKENMNWQWMLVAVIAAMLLLILPIRSMLHGFWPHWLWLVLLYGVITWPKNIQVGWAFVAGLITDLLLGQPLGLAAFINTLTIFLVLFFSPRLKTLPLWRQTTFVFWLMVVYCGCQALMLYVLGVSFTGLPLVFHALSTVLSWPLIVSLFKRI